MAFLLEPQDNLRLNSKIGLTGPERSAQKPFHRKKRASETDATFIDEKHTKCLKCGSRHDHSGALGSPLRLYSHGQQYDLARSCRLSGCWVTAEFYTRDFLNYDMVSGSQHRAGYICLAATRVKSINDSHVWPKSPATLLR